MTTRRNLLAIIASTTAAPSLALPSKAGEHADSALLAACTEFAALEAECAATFAGRDFDDPAEIALEADRERIFALQEACAGTISGMTAQTMAGLRAKAHCLAVWEEEAVIDKGSSFITDRLRTSIFRDLLAGSAAA